jgi:peptidoglycan/LPS O-acetylase OafA/YrhL
MSIVLDRARVLAALAIFYYHIGLNLRLPLSGWGEYSVTTFLLLAIMAAVAFSLPKYANELRPGPYLWARLGRLMPLYLFVNVAVYGISFVVPSRLGRPFTVGELLLSSLGLSQYFGYRYLSLVFWFIPFIIQVYVLIAFGNAYIERLRNWWWLPVAFGLFWLEILVVGAVSQQPLSVLRNWSPLFRPAEMLLGVQSGLWMTGRLPGRAFAGQLGLYAGLSGLLACGAIYDQRLAYAYTLPLSGAIVTAAVVGVAWLLGRGPQVISAPLWRRLGRATYPFYLIHGLAILFLFHRFGSSAAIWLGYAACCALAALALDAMFSVRRRPAAVQS